MKREINTMPQDEYSERLFEAMRRMNKKISGLEFEEDLRYMKAKDEGDEEKALKHWFNRMALFWAGQAIVIAPGKLKERIDEINRREFSPKINDVKSLATRNIIHCDRCGLEYMMPANPEIIPFEEVDGKLYCINCVEWHEETKSYKLKVEEDRKWT